MERLNDVVYYYENYTPVGDIVVLATCLVFLILMKVAYNVRSKNYSLLQGMIVCLMAGTVGSIVYHMLTNYVGTVDSIYIYISRGTQHIAFFIYLYLYVFYVMEPLQLDYVTGRKYILVSTIGLIGFSLYDILGTVFRFGFYIDGKTIHSGFSFFFAIAYVFFVGIIAFLLLYYKGRMVKQILYAILGSFLVSMTVMGAQGSHHQVSFTASCFLFPIITLLYMIHSNPYNIEIGAVNVKAFEDMITYINNKQKTMILMSLYMPEFEGTGKHYPKEVQELIRGFTHRFFKNAVLFQISSGRMILSVDPKKNPDYKLGADEMLKHFYAEYPRFRLDYKIVFMKTYDEISEKHDYIKMIMFLERKMDFNTVCIVGEKEVADFNKMNYVLSQIEDIKKQGNLNDPRVEVYCQPVLNIATGKYDTAEALMRMRLPDTGMVFPDVFIPIAEEHGCIHALSRIILSKTCIRIKKLMGQGFNVQRISVNFSVGELKDPGFCDDINGIINDVGIPHDKIAIEITESQNESEFMAVKNRIEELKGDGIKFYLDDFGTGYSNFERIMELPFDIIKFDRSLVIACGSDEKSEKMVTHLARMFSAMDYSVLYEGVETEQDEQKCIRMSARYLQGYKYSKPIPMEELSNWFDKSAS